MINQFTVLCYGRSIVKCMGFCIEILIQIYVSNLQTANPENFVVSIGNFW